MWWLPTDERFWSMVKTAAALRMNDLHEVLIWEYRCHIAALGR